MTYPKKIRIVSSILLVLAMASTNMIFYTFSSDDQVISFIDIPVEPEPESEHDHEVKTKKQVKDLNKYHLFLEGIDSLLALFDDTFRLNYSPPYLKKHSPPPEV